jgi:FKBP-type peptidyl-prolyl cis-trans isomerases 1
MRTPFRFAAALSAGLALIAPAVAGAADPAMDEAARMQYALGYQLGKDLVAIDARPQDLAKGIEDGRSGAKARLTDEEMNAALAQLEQNITAQRSKEQAEAAQKQAEAAQKALVEGKAFLAANGKKPGVKTTASGLQYRMITAGKGRKPAATDTVTVQYKGTLTNGTEFDSSYKRGQAATFPLNGVIPGWTEGVQLMPVGSKFELTIPPELAYGAQGPLANQVLVFEVELLDAKAAAEATGTEAPEAKPVEAQ